MGFTTRPELRGGCNLKLNLLFYAVAALFFVWSRVHPKDWLTWLMESLPVMAGAVILLATARRFPLTPLAHGLIAVHMVILLVGAKYSYAEVPLGNWVREAFHLGRNHYDRLGHFAQGFVPAILAREVLLRRSPLQPGKWLFFLVLCVCLSISATYELIEWTAAAVMGQSADAFLGTQGDAWDAQKDMLLAAVGAVLAQAVLARVHDRQLAAGR